MGVLLHSKQPSDYLPHRFPFLFLDKITDICPGVSACAKKLVTDSPEGFPTILLIECIAQLAGIAANHKEGEGGFLATIDHAEFYDNIRQGDLLTVTVRIIKSFGRLCLVEGFVERDGSKVVQAQMTLGIGKV